MKKVIFGIGALATILTFGNTALAGGTPCAPEAKKFEWHICVVGPVEYKRGMKKDTRDECVVDKVIAKGKCELGDLASYIPEGTDQDTVRFYAIVPDGMKLDDYEIQYVTDESDEYGHCSIEPTSFDPWRTMKFSEAFDKGNSERSDMVIAKLKKKKKAFFASSFFLRRLMEANCKGKKAAMGMVDKKTQSKYVFMAEATFQK